MRLSHSLLLAFTTLFLLSACSATRSKIKKNLAFLGVNYHTYSHVADSYFRGQLYFDDSQAYFKSCEGDIEYEVINNESLNEVYKQVTRDEDDGAPVYIEFEGELTFDDSTDNQVSITLDSIHHMSESKVSLQCAKATDTFDFKAKGNAPYWRINIHQNDIFFATKASNQSFKIQNFALENNNINYFQGTNQQGEHLFLKILPKPCYVQNEKEYWRYSTQVSTIYGEFLGCGESGQQNDHRPFVGKYTNQTTGEQLTLSNDNSVNYHKSIGQDQTMKSGFWKSNSSQKVVVMFTTENHKAIQEELVFTRHNKTLTSLAINQDNAITTFATPLLLTQTSTTANTHTAQDQEIVRQFSAQSLTPDENVDQQVQLALQQYFSIHRTDPKKTQFNSVRFDLNDDGYDDAIVLLDWCSGEQCELLIFQGSSTGFQFSSRVSLVEAPIIVSKRLHFLWQSLLIKTADHWSQLNFDGQSYPLHSRDAKPVEDLEAATQVRLFSEGKPTHWHYIKQQ